MGKAGVYTISDIIIHTVVLSIIVLEGQNNQALEANANDDDVSYFPAADWSISTVYCSHSAKQVIKRTQRIHSYYVFAAPQTVRFSYLAALSKALNGYFF